MDEIRQGRPQGFATLAPTLHVRASAMLLQFNAGNLEVRH
jgi:hypothetical protein